MGVKRISQEYWPKLEEVFSNGIHDGHTHSRRCGNQSEGLWMPFKTRRLGRELLDQQMWCFGRDIVRGEGNLLVEYGFVKNPSPPGNPAPSTYSLSLAPGVEVRLWASAVLYASGDWALILKRRKFSPALIDAGELPQRVWSPAHLPASKKPGSDVEYEAARLRLAEVLAWLGDYEAWVREVAGVSYRRSCLSGWESAVVPAEKMSEAWHNLALHFRESVPATTEKNW